MQMYTIKPLVWDEYSKNQWMAHTVYGNVYATKNGSVWETCYEDSWRDGTAFPSCAEAMASVQESIRKRLVAEVLNPVVSKSGNIADIIGKWPGDETDEEVRKALEELG